MGFDDCVSLPQGDLEGIQGREEVQPLRGIPSTLSDPLA